MVKLHMFHVRMMASVLGTSIKTAIFSNTVEGVRVNVYNACTCRLVLTPCSCSTNTIIMHCLYGA